MGRKLLLAILLCISFELSAQQSKIDSLRIELRKEVSDTTRFNLIEKIAIETYYIDMESYKVLVDSMFLMAEKINSTIYSGHAHNAMGRYYFRKGSYDTTQIHYKRALRIYEQLGSDSNLAIVYGNLGAVFINKGKIDSSQYYYFKALTINQKIKSHKQLFFNYYNLGISESIKNNSEKVIEYILAANRHAEIINNQRYISYCNSLIGVTYLELMQYDEAKNYIEKAINDLKELEDYSGLADQYVNLGKLYNESEKDYQTAISYYKNAVINYDKVLNEHNKTVAIGNIGRNFIKLNQLDSAKAYLTKSYLLAKKMNQSAEEARSISGLGEIELKEGRFTSAETRLQEALIICNQHKFRLDGADIKILLSKLYDRKGQYKLAYLNYLEGKEVLDSIISNEQTQIVASINTKYQTEKKEKELVEQQKATKEQELIAEKESKQKWLFAMGLLLVAIASLLVYRRYISEKKAKQTITEQKDEIEKQKHLVEKLQKELHHRLKNNLAFIDVFINLAKSKFPNPVYQEKLNELQNRIASMFEVHKQLFQKEDATSLNAKTYINALLQNVQNIFSMPNISINHKIDDNEVLEVDASFPIGLIVNEFVTNSFKHAFDDIANGNIIISLRSDKGVYHLELSDNGKGLPINLDIENLDSFGIDIIQLLTDEYGGKFSLKGDNGVTMNITLPKTSN